LNTSKKTIAFPSVRPQKLVKF